MTNYGVLIYASLGLAGFRPLLLNACWTTFTIVGNTWTGKSQLRDVACVCSRLHV